MTLQMIALITKRSNEATSIASHSVLAIAMVYQHCAANIRPSNLKKCARCKNIRHHRRIEALENSGGAGPVLIVALAAVVLLAFLACFLAHATLTGIYSAVLYRYAVNGSGAPGFDGTLNAAFQQKA